MQNPNEDTEWNDILRKKGIIPEKEKELEVTEETNTRNDGWSDTETDGRSVLISITKRL